MLSGNGFLQLTCGGEFVPSPSFSAAKGCGPYNGSVYIFVNRARNRIKLLHWEPGGMVIYSKLLEAGTFGQPDLESRDDVKGTIEWRDLELVVEGIMEKADSRRQRLETLKKLRRY